MTHKQTVRSSESFRCECSLSRGKPPTFKPISCTDMMSVLVYHHDLMQTCRLLWIPAFFINRKLSLCNAIFWVDRQCCLCASEQNQQLQHKTCHCYQAFFVALIPSPACCCRLDCSLKSHVQPWIILTFHIHNSPLLLFFLSTGFKSQAGAWERKTVCWNLRIVFSAPLSKP